MLMFGYVPTAKREGKYKDALAVLEGFISTCSILLFSAVPKGKINIKCYSVHPDVLNGLKKGAGSYHNQFSWMDKLIAQFWMI